MKNQTKKVNKKNINKLATKVGYGAFGAGLFAITAGLTAKGASGYLSHMTDQQKDAVSIIVVALLYFGILTSIKKLSK